MYIADGNRYSIMEYDRCGNSGLRLPKMSLGLWQNFGSNAVMADMKEMIFTAFDNGITHFDLANNYGPVAGSAEKNFGDILNKELKQYRNELLISTKAGYKMWEGPYGNYGSRKYLLSSLDESLMRMKLDYVDIFYHHRMDTETPLEESMGALATAVHSGKALYAGISNYDKETTEKAMKILMEMRCPFIINQVRYSILDRHIETDGLKDFAKKSGIGIIAFSPLAQGVLTDRYLRGIPSDSRIKKNGISLKEENLTADKMEAVRKLNQMAICRGQSLAQMALSWILKDKSITGVLIGASSGGQILDNLKSLHYPLFDEEELNLIDEITKEVTIW